MAAPPRGRDWNPTYRRACDRVRRQTPQQPQTYQHPTNSSPTWIGDVAVQTPLRRPDRVELVVSPEHIRDARRSTYWRANMYGRSCFTHLAIDSVLLLPRLVARSVPLSSTMTLRSKGFTFFGGHAFPLTLTSCFVSESGYYWPPYVNAADEAIATRATRRSAPSPCANRPLRGAPRISHSADFSFRQASARVSVLVP